MLLFLLVLFSDVSHAQFSHQGRQDLFCDLNFACVVGVGDQRSSLLVFAERRLEESMFVFVTRAGTEE